MTYITPHTPQPKKHPHLIDYVQDTDRTSSRHLHLGSIPYNHHCRIGCSLSPILSPIIPLDINQSSHSHARNCHVRYGTHAEGLRLQACPTSSKRDYPGRDCTVCANAGNSMAAVPLYVFTLRTCPWCHSRRLLSRWDSQQCHLLSRQRRHSLECSHDRRLDNACSCNNALTGFPPCRRGCQH